MCADGVDLGHHCRHCGGRLLSCRDEGPYVSWHADQAEGEACAAALVAAAGPEAAEGA